MPKPVDWTPLLPQALAALRAMTAPAVDRAMIERLLKIHRRTAIRLLHQFGAQPVGNNLLLPRERLIQELEAFLPSDGELPARTPSQLRRLHREADEFRFQDVRTSDCRTVDRLPATVQIAPGKLTVEAEDVRQLCERLWILLETCKEDWPGVAQKFGGPT
jgi:hypothetical protein